MYNRVPERMKEISFSIFDSDIVLRPKMKIPKDNIQNTLWDDANRRMLASTMKRPAST
jgi:hypothetical protein